MTLQPSEIKLLIALMEAQKASVGLLRGFAKPTYEEQNESAYYNKLIKKLNDYLMEVKNKGI